MKISQQKGEVGRLPLPASLLATGILIFVSVWSWSQDTVASYQIQGVGTTKIALRVVPVALTLLILVIRDARRNFGAWFLLFRRPAIVFTFYVVIGALSSLQSQLPSLGLWKCIEFLTLLYWCVSTSLYFEAKQEITQPLVFTISLITLSCFYLVIGAATDTVASFNYSPGLVPIWLRGVVPSVNPNTIGVLSATALAAWLWTGLKLKVGRTVYLLILATLALAFVSAQSRTAYLSFALVMGIAAIRGLRSGKRKYANARAISYISLAIFLTALSGKVEETFMRGQDITEMETLTGRAEFWDVGLASIQQKPWLGGGLATGSRFLYLDRPDVFGKMVNLHSSIIEAIVSAGVIGALPMLSAMFVAFLCSVASEVKSGETLRLKLASIVIIMMSFRAVTSSALAFYSLDLQLFMLAILALSMNKKSRPRSIIVSVFPRDGAKFGRKTEDDAKIT